MQATGKTTLLSGTLKLSGRLASGQTFVVSREDANQAIKDVAQASEI